MTQAKHTPGPWFIEHHDWLEKGYCCISSKNSVAFANVVWQMKHDELIGRNSPKQEANDRLIAAAPELLEALQDCVTALHNLDYRAPELAPARAAIAKATGAILGISFGIFLALALSA